MVHLFEYRAVPGHEAELTGFLRRRPLGTPNVEGLVAVIAARRLSQNGHAHLAVTCWRDAPCLARGTDAAGLPAPLTPTAELVGDRVSSHFRAAVQAGLGRTGARVLRVYRTSVKAGLIGDWEARALESAGQIAAKDGISLILAGVEIDEDETTRPSGEVRVVVMTAWTEWDLLLDATGGRLNRAILDTELADLEKPAVADHFEILASEAGPG